MKAIILQGLGFGDEGKGTMTEYLAVRDKADLVIRYNGGCQAGHNIVTNDGKTHCFSQFGSATLAGVKTFLSKYMMVEPFALLNEAKALSSLGVSDVLDMVRVDFDAPLVTPYHVAVNRLKEMARGHGHHGSCGRGIGETMELVLKYGFRGAVPSFGDFDDRALLKEKLAWVQERMVEKYQALLDSGEVPNEMAGPWTREVARLTTSPESILRQLPITDLSELSAMPAKFHLAEDLKKNPDMTLLFEGAQGVLLDQDFGFQPHTTWSNCTFENALSILRDAKFEGEKKFVGVTRAYQTRHGAGPMPTESAELTKSLRDPHNQDGGYQGNFRAGPLDLVMLRYALNVIGGVDELAVTHLDTVMAGGTNRFCYAYEVEDQDRQFFIFDASRVKQSRTLKVNRIPTFEGMKEVTEVLKRVKPQYAKISISPAEENIKDSLLCAAISSAFDTPVQYTSHGPSIADKRG